MLREPVCALLRVCGSSICIALPEMWLANPDGCGSRFSDMLG